MFLRFRMVLLFCPVYGKLRRFFVVTTSSRDKGRERILRDIQISALSITSSFQELTAIQENYRRNNNDFPYL